jgi:hypothetical protein
LLLFSSSLVFARPFTTDEFGTVDHEIVEFESGFDLTKDENGAYLSLKHGVTPRMDIGAAFSILPEVGDFSLCWKVKLLEREGFGCGMTYAWAPGDKGFDLNAIIGAEISGVTFSLNLGGISSFDSLNFGLLAYLSPMERLSLGGEVWGERSEDETSLEILIGAFFSVSEELILDAGAGISTGSPTTYKATLGCTWDL